MLRHLKGNVMTTKGQRVLPGSIPSVFGASKMGFKIVTFFTVTFLQSYGWNVQNGESCSVMFESTISLDHMIWISGPLV